MKEIKLMMMKKLKELEELVREKLTPVVEESLQRV